MNERGAAGLTDTRPARGQSARGGAERSRCPRSADCAEATGRLPQGLFWTPRLPGSPGAPGRSGAEAFLLCFSSPLLETDGEADVAFQGTGAGPSLGERVDMELMEKAEQHSEGGKQL